MAREQEQEKISAGEGGARHGVAILILANALLALGPLFVRLADTGPVAAGFWRMALAFPLIALIALVAPAKPGASATMKLRTGPSLRRSNGSFALWLVIAASGVLFAADLASWHLGIVRTKMANATLFGNSASLLFPLYGFLVARAWPSRAQGLALGLAFVGAGLLMGRSAELSPKNLAGDLLSFLAGVFYAAYFIAVARARESLAAMPLLAASTFASAVPLLFIALAFGETIVPTDWMPLVALALLSQVLGQGMMVYALGTMSPLVVGLALLTQPVIAASVGWAVFGERLGALDLVGAALVATALVLVRRD